jgi:hypothetical protein
MNKRKMVFLDRARLENVKSLYKQGSPQVAKQVSMLQGQAEEALSTEQPTVMTKSFVPPSGDKHDYVSLGPYWWPNPDTEDGLPYIRRDGVRNPEIQSFDASSHGKLQTFVRRLALAYFFTGEQRYAAKAATMLHTWYVDPATRMNPNLNFAQMIPGLSAGRGIGLIETRHLGYLLDFVSLLTTAEAWSKELDDSLLAWFQDYFHWLLHSKNGQDESKEPNNHGAYYDVQAASLALHLGEKDVAANILNLIPEKRYFKHIEPDGKQPRELARTLSLSYSMMNLIGLMDLARLGESIGLDLWHASSDDGRSLRAALDFLAPYAAGSLEWPYRQIKPAETDRVFELYRKAANAYGERQYERIAARAGDDENEGAWFLKLIYPASSL